MIDEQICWLFWCDFLVTWNEVNHFRKVTNHNENGCVTINANFRKIRDVSKTCFPWIFRNSQGLQRVPKLPWLPGVWCLKAIGWCRLEVGCSIEALPLLWCELELPDLGVMIVDERHKEFSATSVCDSIRVAYFPVCQLIIKSARTEPFLRPPMYRHAASFTEISSFQ